jgi:opacity protein-like surface antigen
MFCLLMILGAAPPALTAAHRYNRLILLTFFQTFVGALASALAGRPGNAESALMRLIGVLGLVGILASPAFAADYDIPVLRGGQTPLPVAPVTTVGPALFTRWSGFYVGGDLSFNNATADFGTSTAPLVQLALQDTPVPLGLPTSQLQLLTKAANSAFGGGVFLGYNTQWQDLVVGVEANYTHTHLSATSSNSIVIARSFNPPVGNATSVSLSGATGQMNLTDFAEARGRAGYVVGNLLPYGFIGMVVGGGSNNVSMRVDAFCGALECVGFPLTPSAGQSNLLLWGYSVGAGLDWAVTPNILLRAEFDFDQFAPVNNISLAVVSGRVGAGYKF